MKTAIQYAIACDYLKSGDVEGLERVFKAAMLDAFKAGMTEAAEIARQNEFGHKPFCDTPEVSILKARDSKTSV